MSAPQDLMANGGSGERLPIISLVGFAKSVLVAGDHVLSNALQADEGIGNERRAPESAVVFAQIVRGKHRTRALRNGNAIGAGYRRVRAVQVGRLHFHIAHVGLAGQPVLAGKERRVRISKSAGRRDYREADKARADNFLLGGFGSGRGNRSFHHEVVSPCRRAGRVWQFPSADSCEC